MNELQVFNYEGADVRTGELNGEPALVLKDVCDALGLSNSRMIADRLDDDEKGVSIADTLGGKQEMAVVPDDLTRVKFVSGFAIDSLSQT